MAETNTVETTWRCRYPNCVAVNPGSERFCSVANCYGFNYNKNIPAGSFVLNEIINMNNEVKYISILTDVELNSSKREDRHKGWVTHCIKPKAGDVWEVLEVSADTTISYQVVVGILPKPKGQTDSKYFFPLGTMPIDIIRV